MSILWAVLLLSILVLVHELGHFTVAKLTGVKVIAFSIGFGPKLFAFTIGETEYRVCAFLLGGYVKMLGQESFEPIPAGVTEISDKGAAYLCGIRKGDLIVSVFDREINSWVDIQDELLLHDDKKVPITILRDGNSHDFVVQVEQAIDPHTLPEEDDGSFRGCVFPDMKMTIENHPEELKRAFFKKPLWARFAIVFAGPATSLLFPIVLYFAYFLSVSDLPSSQIGQVIADTPAAKAGLLAGDKIIAIDKKETPYWESMSKAIRDKGGKKITLSILREDQELSIELVPEPSKFVNQVGDTVKSGRIGISASTTPAFVGNGGKNSPAYKAGIRLKDKVIALNGQKISFIWELDKQLEEVRLSGRTILLTLERISEDGSTKTIETKITPEKRGGTFWLGLYSADTLVGECKDDFPAKLAGISVGDRIVSVNGKQISTWMVIEQVLRESMEVPINFVVETNGIRRNVTVRQTKEIVKGELQEDITRYRFGAFSAVSYDDWIKGERVAIDNRFGFAVSSSIETLIDITLMELNIFAKLFSGQVPLKMLGGPIMIFDIAGKAAEQGWQSYLWIMALISVNLGILNFLPIPVLDGGHLMFFTIEAIMRKPLNTKIKEKAILAGFVMLMMLMVLVFKNDVERYWDVFFN